MNFVKIRKTLSILLLFPLFFYWFNIKVMPIETYKFSEKNSNKIALTFDDGPHPKLTNQILDVLEEYNIKATFFVIGNNVDNYPEPLKRAVLSGHEIGNHTNTHTLLEKLNFEEIKKEISECQNKIFNLTGYTTTVLRPPCGKYNENVIKAAKEMGYKTILWNIDTHDWSHASKEEIVKNINTNIKGGDIILFHDYISGKQNTVGALKIIIPALREKGFDFVTVDELLNEK